MSTFDTHAGFAARNGYPATDCTGELQDTGERLGTKAVLSCDGCDFDIAVPASWITSSDGSTTTTTVGQSGDCPF